MASGENNCQDQVPWTIPYRQQLTVVQDLVNIFQLLNFRKYDSNIRNIMKTNPWLRTTIDIFIESQDKELKEAIAEMEEKTNERQEFVNVREKTIFNLELNNRKCIVREVQIGWNYAVLMKLLYQTSKDDSPEWRKHLVQESQEKLLTLINDYEIYWRDLAPSISHHSMPNLETGEMEIRFCRKRFHISHHKRAMRERQETAMRRCTANRRLFEKENKPLKHEAHSETSMQTDCSKNLKPLVVNRRRELKQEVHRLRMVSCQKARDRNRPGLVEIQHEFRACINIINQIKKPVDDIEKILSRMNLNEGDAGQ